MLLSRSGLVSDYSAILSKPLVAEQLLACLKERTERFAQISNYPTCYLLESTDSNLSNSC